MKSVSNTDVLIIGGGLSGASTAYFLAKKSLSVCVLDGAETQAQAGSFIPIAVLKPHFAVDRNLFDQFYTSGFQLTHQVAESLLNKNDFQTCGLFRLLGEDTISARYKKLLLRDDLKQEGMIEAYDPKRSSEQIHFKTEMPTLWMSKAAWIKPRVLCERLLQSSPLIQLQHSNVKTVEYTQGFWQAYSATGLPLARARICVLAPGVGFSNFPLLQHLPLRRVPGQISFIQACPESEKLAHILNHQNILTPAINGWHTLSGSFRAQNPHLEQDPAEHFALLDNLLQACPSLKTILLKQPYKLFVGTRISTPDYLPYVGALPEYQEFLQDCQGLRFGKFRKRTPPVPYHKNCYINIGHGARGLSSCLISGATLSAMIAGGGPWPLSQDILRLLHPARFWIKSLKRGVGIKSE